MANKKLGQLTVTPLWAKHLRKFWKRHYWKGERQAGKRVARKNEEKS